MTAPTLAAFAESVFEDAWERETELRSDAYRAGLSDGVVAALTGDYRPSHLRPGSPDRDAYLAGHAAGFAAGEDANRARSAERYAELVRADGAR